MTDRAQFVTKQVRLIVEYERIRTANQAMTDALENIANINGTPEGVQEVRSAIKLHTTNIQQVGIFINKLMSELTDE